MKKIISILLVSALFVTIICCGLPGAAAANKVDESYAQRNINSFVSFLKKSGKLINEDYYYFKEETFDKNGTTIKPEYFYDPGENTIRIKSLIEYANANVLFYITLSADYDGKCTFDYDYIDRTGETLQATAQVSIPSFNGKNAAFTKTGGNSAETPEQVNRSCNLIANLALINADNYAYRNGRLDTGLYGFGFTAMCAHHAYEYHTTPAKMGVPGSAKRKVCIWCALQTTGGTAIPAIYSITLNKTAFYYNGKVQKPTVVVKDTKGKVLKEKQDYLISYSSSSKAIGKYELKVIFKGNYSGSKTYYYTINPGKPQIAKLTAAKKALSIKWGKVNAVSGYQIQYANNSAFKNAKTTNVKGAVNITKKLTSLASGKRCYVKIRSYKATTFNGEKVYIYSGWSSVRNAVVK